MASLFLRSSRGPSCPAGRHRSGGARQLARSSGPRRAPRAVSEGGGGGGGPLPEEHGMARQKVCHQATSAIWDGETLEEAAQRELAHLRRTHVCMPGLGGHCGERFQPGTASESDGDPADGQGSHQTATPPAADAGGGGGSIGGGGSGGLSPTIPGEPNSVVLVEAGGGAPSRLLSPVPRRWRVRFSRAPSPVVGGPAWPAAASVGGEERSGSGGGGGQQQQEAASKRQRKPRQQLKAGAVSLPVPAPHTPVATEPPQADATAAARWQEAPPLAPPMGAATAAGSAACGVGGSDGIVYADSASQELLMGPGLGRQAAGAGTAASSAAVEAEPAPQYRQAPEVLRLFADDPSGTRYSQPAAAALDVTFRASMPVLAVWLLAERIVAPAQLAWSVLRGALPPVARRPAQAVLWAVFAAAVLWPLF